MNKILIILCWMAYLINLSLSSHAQTGDLDGFWKKVNEGESPEDATSEAQPRLNAYHAKVLEILHSSVFVIEQSYVKSGESTRKKAVGIGAVITNGLITSEHLQIPGMEVTYGEARIGQFSKSLEKMESVGERNPEKLTHFSLYPEHPDLSQPLTTASVVDSGGILFTFFLGTNNRIITKSEKVKLIWTDGSAPLPKQVNKKDLLGGVYVIDHQTGTSLDFQLGGLLTAGADMEFSVKKVIVGAPDRTGKSTSIDDTNSQKSPVSSRRSSRGASADKKGSHQKLEKVEKEKPEKVKENSSSRSRRGTSGRRSRGN